MSSSPRERRLGGDLARLRHLPVFACLDDEALRLVAFSAETRSLPPGHVLFRRGDPADGAVLVVAGRLALDAEHGDDLSIRWVGAGALLDESALLAPSRRTATASADAATTVMSVSRAAVSRVLEAYPENAMALRRYWAERLAARLVAVRAAVP